MSSSELLKAGCGENVRLASLIQPNWTSIETHLAALVELPHWVAWRRDYDRARATWTKRPFTPGTGKLASSTNADTWGTYEQAKNDVLHGNADGVGFVLTDTPYFGFDFDHVVDGESVLEGAREYTDRFCTYTELSPSGTGLRGIGIGSLPPVGRKKAAYFGRNGDATSDFEIYDSGRYLTITGKTLPELFPVTIRDCSDMLTAMHRDVFGEAPTPQPTTPAPAPQSVASASDAEVLKRARGAKNGPAFERLWAGDATGYASHSEADLALCSLLAFWTGPDTDRLVALFRQSGLCRPKWDAKHGDKTYGEMTVAKALDGKTDFYDWNSVKPLTIKADENLTEDKAHASELTRRLKGQYRYIWQWKRWYGWDGRVWAEVPVERVALHASEVLRALYAERLGETNDKHEMAHWAKLAQQTCRIDSMLRALRFLGASDGFMTETSDLDADLWLLNLENGILDLRTRTLRPHAPEALMTKLAPVRYDPSAEAPLWREHTRYFLPSDSIRRQVQRDLGTALVGAHLEESLPIWYGKGGNGKTTTMLVVMELLGDYAKSAAPGLLLQKKYEAHPTEIADLRGARIVTSVEPDEGLRLNASKVKELTGGERRKARYMRADFFEYEPTDTIFLIANHRPQVWDMSEGIWRRLRLVPWEQEVEKHKQRDQSEVVAELVAEGSGVLNWLLDGLADRMADRSWVAPEVLAATEDYRDDEDPIAPFLFECCVLKSHCTVAIAELYEAYTKWCARTGTSPMGKRTFGNVLRAKGLDTRKGAKGVREWSGIGLGA
jgi:putative DNA primase/helicase